QLGLTFIWSLMVARTLPGGLAQQTANQRCDATCVVSNFGRAMVESPLPRCEQKIVAGNVTLTGVECFAPVRHGTAVTVALVFYACELAICMQYDGRRITEPQADDLMATFLGKVRASLDSVRRAAPDSRRRHLTFSEPL